jgi:DnaD/phage-associated family protein
MLRQKEGDNRYLRRAELLNNADLMRGMAVVDTETDAREILDAALERAIERGALLAAQIETGDKTRRLYFINDKRGSELQRQAQSGQWRPSVADEIEVLPPRPTLFAIYEENIGVLTPMLAETITEAQATYPREWIEDAIRYAVERNARSWRYISKVLEAWQQEGRSRETSGRLPRGPRRYTAGKRKDFIKS